MSTATTAPGCFLYFFVVCVSLMGYLPFGHHGADFSKDSKKLAYTYNNKEVRIYDLEKREAGEPIYTAAAGYVVDTVHWNRGADDIYAVSHNYTRCDENEKTDENGVKTESKTDWKWNVEILRLKPSGGAPASVTKREYYCPDLQGPLGGMGEEPGAATKTYHAPYQKGLDENSFNFKPTGWADGSIYYVEPEELTKRPSTVYKMDLSNGKSEKLYEIPADGSSYMLSPSAKYLVYMSVAGEKGDETFSVVLKDLKSGEELLREVVAKPPPEDIANPGKKKDGEDNLLMLLGILTGVDGVAAFDEEAGQFFYLKMDTETKLTSLVAFDIASKKSKTIRTGFGLAAPLPIPQRKALLVTGIDADALQKNAAPMAMPTIDASAPDTVSLISYSGEVIKTYDNIPPILFPLFHMRAPDVAVSPDGNKVALTYSNSISGDDGPKPYGHESDATGSNPFAGNNSVLPSIIDLEKGTYEILITKPVDYYYAGIGMYEMKDTKAAIQYLEKFLAANKPGDPGFKKAAFSLYVCYQDAGKQPEQDALYDKIMKDVVAGAESPALEFSLNYLTAAASAFADSYAVRQELKLEDLPNLEALKKDRRDFVVGELKKAEAGGSKKASYVLAAVYAKTGGNAEAIKQFEKTFSDYGGTLDDQPLNFDFVIAQLYAEDGKEEKALEYYTKYIGAESGWKMYEREAREARAGSCEKLGRWAEALEDYEYLLNAARNDYNGAVQAEGPGADTANSYISTLKDKVTQFETKVAEASGKLQKK